LLSLFVLLTFSSTFFPSFMSPFISLLSVQHYNHWVSRTVSLEVRSRDSSVSIVTAVRTRWQGLYFLHEQGSFSWPPRPDRLCGPASLLSNGYWE
jgi:hypothetical protein